MTGQSVTMDSSAGSKPKRAWASLSRRRRQPCHEEILAAAFEEFAARGYAEACLDDLPLLQEQRTSLSGRLARSDLALEEREAFVQTFKASAEELACGVLSRHRR